MNFRDTTGQIPDLVSWLGTGAAIELTVPLEVGVLEVKKELKRVYLEDGTSMLI